MFGRSKPKNEEITPVVPIQTIPAEFYGGANPTIKFKNVEREVVLNTQAGSQSLAPHQKAALDKATAVGSGNPKHPVHLLSNRKFLFIGGGILFVLFIGGASAYYYWIYKKAAPAAIPAPVISIPEPTPVVVEPQPEVAVTTTPVTPVEVVTPTDIPPQFPSRLLTDSKDSDGEGLTDAEEELYNTDPEVPDTDKDKYIDAHEVYNLYNPAGKEPEKIIDSNLVVEWQNPVFGYAIYYPKNWAFGTVDPNYRDVLFSTITGENIEIRVFDKQENQSFTDWFAATAPGERLSDLTPFTSAFRAVGLRRGDYLVYYFEDATHRYALIYHTTDSTTVNYRTVMKMLARSFRLANGANTIAPRITEGGEEAATTSVGVVSTTIPNIETASTSTASSTL